ncbi:SAM-dependent methyltransferase [Streptomyces sp. NPDC005438]|uniref:SAM-dependent methyltransferase n=1 Tax=Streptomyces sp. NPDC005438 TaxID=3156880 RepID=UPI0033BAEA25
MGTEGTPDLNSLDLRVDRPHTARVYDYYLGGKTHYEADREAGDQVMAAWPGAPLAARVNRSFMLRACRVLASEYGITQFLDIGTGIPTEPNLHQGVQDLVPEARVMYVDNDPIVLAHARALMVGSPEGRTSYLHADFTEPEAILDSDDLRATLDLDRPVALSVLALLHFVPDDRDPGGILRRLTDALVPGSALVLSHGTGDFDSEAMGQVARVYQSSGTGAQARSKEELRALFHDLELIEPGIEVPHRWRPETSSVSTIGGGDASADDAAVAQWAGVAIKRR